MDTPFIHTFFWKAYLMSAPVAPDGYTVLYGLEDEVNRFRSERTPLIASFRSATVPGKPRPYENGLAHLSTPHQTRQFLNGPHRTVRPRHQPPPLDLQLRSHMGQVRVSCLRDLYKGERIGDRGTWPVSA